MDFADFLRRDPPPDLQALAERYGGLGHVPEAEMAAYQAALRAWNLRRLAR